MTSLIALFVFTITVPFALLLGVLAAPFGKADEVGNGYEHWICEIASTPEECNELLKGVGDE